MGIEPMYRALQARHFDGIMPAQGPRLEVRECRCGVGEA